MLPELQTRILQPKSCFRTAARRSLNKEVDKACDAFRASEELEPRVGTLLNLGDCEEQRKRVASAWNVFIDAKDLAAKVHDERGAKAAARAKALEPRLPYVTLAVQRVPGLVVQRDGADVALAEWDHEIPIDPRAYELAATAPGYKPWSTRIDVVEGQHLHVVRSGARQGAGRGDRREYAHRTSEAAGADGRSRRRLAHDRRCRITSVLAT